MRVKFIKNIMIWGTGELGKKVYINILKYSDNYRICYFGDNDSSKKGLSLYNVPIIGIDELKYVDNIDYIIIASMYKSEMIKSFKENNIKQEILEEWNQLEEMPYSTVTIEISGKCNAKCEWCVTGRENKYSINNIDKFMTTKDFKKIYFYLLKNNIIPKETVIYLYNWGEPFLNKSFKEIIEFLSIQKNKFSLSTNASRVKTFKQDNILEGLDSLTFSMPGFSQESYDKIHGFKFEKIKDNIKIIVESFRQNGFNGKCYISYHVYQFNKNGIIKAREFADEIGIDILPYYAYFNGMDMATSYLGNTMNYEQLKLSGKELDLFYVDELIKNRPKKYNCPQFNYLTIEKMDKYYYVAVQTKVEKTIQLEI